MNDLKGKYQYRKWVKKADRQGKCKECKNFHYNSDDMGFCPVIQWIAYLNYTCDKWKRA